jgi:Ankyrin repeat
MLQMKVVKSLLGHGKDPDEVSLFPTSTEAHDTDRDETTAKAAPCITPVRGKTPLMSAVEQNKFLVCCILMDYGASLDLRDR